MRNDFSADLPALLFALDKQFVIPAMAVVVAVWEARLHAGGNRQHFLLQCLKFRVRLAARVRLHLVQGGQDGPGVLAKPWGFNCHPRLPYGRTQKKARGSGRYGLDPSK
ncbi:hypothetical protein D3C71_1686860 [compost metagenome]